MPQVKRRDAKRTPAKKPRSRAAATAAAARPARREANASSVVFGLAIMSALIVATAAWMGGSMSVVRSHVDNTLDGAARSMGFAVEQIAVIGVDGELESLVRDAAMVEPGENMFRADPYVIRRRIEATRQVRNIRVHRLWPDQVVVLADPAKAVALWRDPAGDWAVIDSFGRFMPGVDGRSRSDLIRVAGEGAPEASPALAAALERAGLDPSDFGVAQYVERNRWNLKTREGVLARMPAGDAMPGAVARLARLRGDERLLDRAVAAVDLRVPDKIYIAPRREPAQAIAMFESAG